jgi:catalase
LNGVFGKHPCARAVHAKGIMLEGTFTPSAFASSLSKAPHLQKTSVPVTVRFSDFAGIPDIPDLHELASPLGLAVKFHLPGGSETDIVGHSSASS